MSRRDSHMREQETRERLDGVLSVRGRHETCRAVFTSTVAEKREKREKGHAVALRPPVLFLFFLDAFQKFRYRSK